MASADWRRIVADVFDAAAPAYAQAIAPIMALIAQDFVQKAGIKPGERTLDLGTGTGVVAHEVAQREAIPVGIDISRAMLDEARRRGSLVLLQADIHQLPFARRSFDLALAQFVLNSSDPAVVLRELWRVLEPGGGLWIQEWDEPDPISEQIADTFAEYCVEDPAPDLAAVRAQAEAPIPWDSIETVEALADLVVASGFGEIGVIQAAPMVRIEDGERLLRYKLAWPIRQAELRAMSSEIRQLCLGDLRENLSRHLNTDGTLDWRPNLVRIRAIKPH